MLAEEEDFTPASLFHRIDGARKGFITERDLEAFLKDQNLNFKGSELKLLFGRVNEAKREEAVRLREYPWAYIGSKTSSCQGKIHGCGTSR
jgi:hypothetical protein